MILPLDGNQLPRRRFRCNSLIPSFPGWPKSLRVPSTSTRHCCSLKNPPHCSYPFLHRFHFAPTVFGPFESSCAGHKDNIYPRFGLEILMIKGLSSSTIWNNNREKVSAAGWESGRSEKVAHSAVRHVHLCRTKLTRPASDFICTIVVFFYEGEWQLAWSPSNWPRRSSFLRACRTFLPRFDLMSPISVSSPVCF